MKGFLVGSENWAGGRETEIDTYKERERERDEKHEKQRKGERLALTEIPGRLLLAR